MNLKKLIILFLICHFNFIDSFGQISVDSVKIYWNNGSMKYLSVCCFVDTVETVDSGMQAVLLRESRLWTPEGREFEESTEQFWEIYGDIVEIEKPIGIGKDEAEYRRLISIADSLFNKLDGTSETANEAIKAYVSAKDLLPEARYPNEQIELIHVRLKEK